MAGVKFWGAALFAFALTPGTALAQATAPAASSAPSPGEYVAITGDCVVCHSLPQGAPNAGGLKMATPLGAIYTTNITPDRDTGIGAWSFEDFERAMRQGISRDGRRLYPAMPYPSYAKMSDEELRALYDYYMKEVKPVRQTNTPNEISFPLNARWPLSLWNWAAADLSRYVPKPGLDPQWNRGAYLVQGPGHCGACHTPRGVIFQEKASDESGTSWLTGANLDNWSAPNLRGDANTGLGRWSEDDIVSFLRNGQSRFGTAFGTMREVVEYSTGRMSDDDLAAIAKYLKSLPPAFPSRELAWVHDDTSAQNLRAGGFDARGSASYMRQCASCHGVDGKGRSADKSKPDLPPLAGNPAVLDPDPASLIRAVLNGVPRLGAQAGTSPDWMPQFRTWLGDGDIADLVTFMRSSWGNRAAAVSAEDVAKLRKATDPQEPLVLRMR
ncbi:MAG: gluconate 2-dehydrogenase cytochrome c subunit [Hyphomicrobiales bacterium]|nr:gluconate 2-dehydrogenase cytochrome c subunit [Hyphomicrobiales bacterium]